MFEVGLGSDSPLVDVGAPEDEESAAVVPVTYGGEELSEEVGEHHPKTSLDVLESEILGLRAAVGNEAGCEVCDEREEGCKGGDDAVHVEVDVVGADGGREISRADAGLAAGVDGTHEASVEKAAAFDKLEISDWDTERGSFGLDELAEFFWGGGLPSGFWRFTANPSSVLDYLLVWKVVRGQEMNLGEALAYCFVLRL